MTASRVNLGQRCVFDAAEDRAASSINACSG
jgi:hypothetical protein